MCFPPTLGGDYRFNLAFREESTGVLVQDIQDETGDPLYCNQAPSLDSKLGPHGYNGSFSDRPAVLISQDAVWQPNRYTGSGTFHKICKGQMVSFGVESQISIAAHADEVYEKFEIENRLDRPLILTVIPDQHSNPRAAGFVRKINKELQIIAVSDLGAAGPEGWRMEIPAKGKRTAHIGLIVQKIGEPAPAGYHVADLAVRVEKGQRGTRDLLKWASEQLPRIYTQNKQLDEFYKRSIMTVLSCRLNRPDCVVQPFYDSGPGWARCWMWDTSFCSEMLTLLDPVGMKNNIRAFFHFGQSTTFVWNNAAGNALNIDYGGYGQNPFAILRLVSDYMLLTGDTAFLDETVDGKTVLSLLKMRAANMKQRYGRPDGLLDFGAKTAAWLEIRTSAYEHVLAAANGMTANL